MTLPDGSDKHIIYEGVEEALAQRKEIIDAMSEELILGAFGKTMLANALQDITDGTIEPELIDIIKTNPLWHRIMGKVVALGMILYSEGAFLPDWIAMDTGTISAWVQRMGNNALGRMHDMIDTGSPALAVVDSLIRSVWLNTSGEAFGENEEYDADELAYVNNVRKALVLAIFMGTELGRSNMPPDKIIFAEDLEENDEPNNES